MQIISQIEKPALSSRLTTKYIYYQRASKTLHKQLGTLRFRCVLKLDTGSIANLRVLVQSTFQLHWGL